MPPPFADGPQSQQPGARTQRINHHVVETPFAIRDVALMNLVGGGVSSAQQERQSRLPRAPLAMVSAHRFADGAPAQQGENGVLGQVGAFAHEEHNQIDGGLLHLRE